MYVFTFPIGAKGFDMQKVSLSKISIIYLQISRAIFKIIEHFTLFFLFLKPLSNDLMTQGICFSNETMLFDGLARKTPVQWN